jgi:hypothetical protein
MTPRVFQQNHPFKWNPAYPATLHKDAHFSLGLFFTDFGVSPGD